MRVVVSGHEGYVGAVLVPLFIEAGHEVIGLDTGWYRGCDLAPVTVVESAYGMRAAYRSVRVTPGPPAISDQDTRYPGTRPPCESKPAGLPADR